MKILVAGSSGLIGKALVSSLVAQGHQVVRLVRRQGEPNAIHWNPAEGVLNPADIEGFDAAINLAGENVAEGRWTEQRKRGILNSRVQATQLLSTTLSRLQNKPKVLINASAIGFYGDCGAKIVDEMSPVGQGFLADVCQKWEAAAEPAVQAGIRVVFTRFGVVLSKEGGALATMLTPFKWGLGGKIGSGHQFMSWVAIEDVVGAIHFVLTHEGLQGPVNVNAPNPVTNEEFTKLLGKALHRPTFFSLPAFAAKLAFGQMADEMLLASARVEPRRLLESGYVFMYPHLAGIFKNL